MPAIPDEFAVRVPHRPLRRRRHRSAPAAWARCIARAMRRLDATSRSRCCPTRSRRTRSGARASSARRGRSPRSTIRTSRTIHGLEEAGGVLRAGHGAGRGPDAGRPIIARGRLPTRRGARASPGRSPTRSRPRTSRASSIATSSPPTSRCAPDGTVKVLDFGLAKALVAAVGQRTATLADSPTDHADGGDRGAASSSAPRPT